MTDNADNTNSKVVTLRGGVPTSTRESNKALTDYVEQLLEQAQSGQVNGLVAVTLEPNGVASFSVVGSVGGYGMVGALDCARQIITEINMDGV